MRANFAPSLALRLESGGGLFCRKAGASNGGGQLLVINADSSGEILKHHPLAIVLHEHIVSPCAGLLERRGPSAVGRLVVPVRVYSVERRSRGAWPHVAKESRKISRPLFAHRDSAPSVERIFGVGRIKAPALGMIPRAKLGRPVIASRMAVREPKRRRHFFVKAAAAFRHPAANALQGQNFLGTAVATKQPAGSSIRRCNPPNSDQALVAFTSNFKRGSHTSDFATVGRLFQGKRR